MDVGKQMRGTCSRSDSCPLLSLLLWKDVRSIIGKWRLGFGIHCGFNNGDLWDFIQQASALPPLPAPKATPCPDEPMCEDNDICPVLKGQEAAAGAGFTSEIRLQSFHNVLKD